MDANAPVELHFSLSPDLLDRLLLLTQQVQNLLANPPATEDSPPEAIRFSTGESHLEAVSSAFDTLRFQALAGEDSQAVPIATSAPLSPLDDPLVAQFLVTDSTPTLPTTVSTPVDPTLSAIPTLSLSVEELSTALRRDCRRYDSGFSLL